MKRFIINIPIYKRDILISIDEVDSSLFKYIKNRLPNNIHYEIENLILSSSTRARTFMFSNGAIIIRVKKNYTKGIIAHEIFHAVQFIMDKLNMPLNDTNDEAYAYLIEYITDKYYETIKN